MIWSGLTTCQQSSALDETASNIKSDELTMLSLSRKLRMRRKNSSKEQLQFKFYEIQKDSLDQIQVFLVGYESNSCLRSIYFKRVLLIQAHETH